MHELILESTNKILKDLCTKELVDRAEEGIWAKELWDVLDESGITSIGVSESLGGAGGDYVDALHVLRLAGKFTVPLPLSETLITHWLLSDYGISPKGEPLTYAIDRHKKVELEEKDGVYIINGKLENIRWARFSNKALILGTLNDRSVITLVPLEKASIIEKANLAGEPMDTVVFKETEVGDLNIHSVKEEDLIKKVVDLEGLTKSVMMSGALDRILELSIQYAKEREQFGRPLYKLQAIQQNIAILSGEVIAALTITNKAIDAYEKGITQNEIDYAKIKVNESAGIATEIAHQVHGAIGATHEHQLHQLTRRLWSWRDEGGNENYWMEKLAEKVMSSDQTFWEMLTDNPIKEAIK